MDRKSIRQQVKTKGIEQAMRLPKGTLTAKQKRFAEAVAMGNTGADAYRMAYSNNQKPKTIGDNASRLKADSRIKTEIERIERANQLAAYHTSEGLRSIVISTLAEIATNPEEKAATRVQAVKSIGQLVGVDAFRETKRIEHVQDSSEIKAQIMAQLKSMMLSTDDAETVDADSLLAELSPVESGYENSQDDSPTLLGDALFATGTPVDPLHTIPLERSVEKTNLERSQEKSEPESSDDESSEDPPSSLETERGGGYISSKNHNVIK